MDRIERVRRELNKHKYYTIDEMVEILRRNNVLYSEYQRAETVRRAKEGLI